MAGTPPPVPGSVAQQQLDQLNSLAGTGSTSSTDLYGLGQWKNQMIDPSGFPPAVVALLQLAKIPTDQQMTGAQLAQAIAQSHNPGLIAQIQNMLLLSGAYGSSVKSMADLQVGTFGQKDIKALADTITVAGQTGTPFGTYLTTAANYGKANGILNSISGAASNPVPVQSRANTDYVLRNMAHTLYGHDPSPDEYARFNAFYNEKLLGEVRDKNAAANPTNTGMPTAGDLGTAIGDLPQDQSQYGGLLTAPPSTVPLLKGPQQRSPDFAGQTVTNPDFTAYQQQVAQDQQAFSAVNGAASGIDSGNLATYTTAPDATAAAEEFLRQDNPGAIGAQNVATKYGTLLKILSGTGA